LIKKSAPIATVQKPAVFYLCRATGAAESNFTASLRLDTANHA